MKQFILIISYLFLIGKCTETENDTFIATEEWQEIKEGQKVPAGLHYRLNLQTGKKEAKLLDEDDSETSISELSDYNTKIVKKLYSAPLRLDYSPKKIARIRNSFKRFKKLKKQFDSLKVNFKTDSELITGLIKEYNKTISNKDSSTSINLEIFENLNYLVHQIDNALWFIDSGGLDHIILPMIVNQTNRDFRIQSLRILGTLTQNNPKAQIKVYEKNFGSYLSNILLQSEDQNELSATLYAFGSLLRKFPVCQREVLSKSGTKALISIITKDTELKIKLKVFVLIADILTDKEHTLNSDEVDSDKLLQYRVIHFEDWLNENDYCNIVEDFLNESKNNVILQANILDEIIQSLSEQKFCHSKWTKSSIMKDNFEFIRKNLNSNNNDEDDDDYYNEITEKFNNFYDKLYLYEKDEL